MFIQELELRSYRNYDSLALVFKTGVNVFVGQNGQGKTNLLEAIHLLTQGQSFRPGKTDILIKKTTSEKSPKSLLRAKIKKKDLEFQVSAQLTSSTKSFYINNKKASSSQLLKSFPTVLFSPESLSAIKEGPDQRRQLIDEGLILQSPSNAQLLNQFKRALRSRNRILKDYRAGHHSFDQAKSLLESINGNYLPLAAAVSLARVEALRQMSPDLKNAMASIADLQNVDISVDYLISSQSAIDWDKQKIYDALHARLKELWRAEMDSGSSLVGPHKHDIRFLFDREDSRYYCSQGQQRALILSFKMAQIMYHYRVYQVHPILLLDDVLSELDPAKRANLVEFLKGINSQIFLTTTDISFPFDFGNREISVYNIEAGRIVKAVAS